MRQNKFTFNQYRIYFYSFPVIAGVFVPIYLIFNHTWNLTDFNCSWFSEESAKNRTRTQYQGGGTGGAMFDTSYANRSRPRLLFSDNLFQSPFRSNVPCNCQIITNCPNIKPGGNIRGRHCGFQGFQRKVSLFSCTVYSTHKS